MSQTEGCRSQSTDGTTPFLSCSSLTTLQHVGIDYGGPITLKGDNQRSKTKFRGHIALFVCMTMRAIHLESIKDLISETFLTALKRFVSRRERPAFICSDNGTIFARANNELKCFFSEERNFGDIHNLLTRQGIEWKFIPPYGPNFGGLLEAGIKSIKGLMKRVIGNTILNFEKMSTLMCQIEACLNSRSLCAMSDDLSSFCYLTPGHFLIQHSPTAIPKSNLTDTPTNRLARWRRYSSHFGDTGGLII